MKAGRELDALVAEKVMGLKPCSDPIGRCDAAKMTPCQCWGTPSVIGIVAGGELACYSTDIAAAWQIVEKLRLTVQPDVISWMAGKKESTHKLYWSDVAEAETAPLAICLVALQIVGYELDVKEYAT